MSESGRTHSPPKKPVDLMAALKASLVAGRVSSLRKRHTEAEAAVWLARCALSDAVKQGEERVRRAEESERIAYHRLYLSVPCAYCGAEAGEECRTTAWPQRHTARAADCMTTPASTPSGGAE